MSGEGSGAGCGRGWEGLWAGPGRGRGGARAGPALGSRSLKGQNLSYCRPSRTFIHVLLYSTNKLS